MTDIMRRELDYVGFDTSAIADEDLPFKYFTVSLRTIQMNSVQFEFSLRFMSPNTIVAVDKIHGVATPFVK